MSHEAFPGRKSSPLSYPLSYPPPPPPRFSPESTASPLYLKDGFGR